MKLGEAIKEVRGERELTQKDLAKRVGITQSHLSQLESGNKEPSLSTLERIAEELDLSVPMLVVLAMDEEDVRPGRKDVYDRFYPKLKSLLNNELAHQ
jgi:transcriptional regulator with XRE-family HTH domain